MKGFVRYCALILVVSLTAIQPSQAGSITYTADFSNRLGLPSLPGFDSSLGQLTQVDLNITGEARGFWYTYETPITSGTFHILFQSLVNENFVGTVQTSDPFTFDSPASSFPWGGGFDMTSTPTNLDLFKTPEVNIYFYCSAWFTDTGSLMQGSLTSVTGTEAITYIFAVPEPPGAMMAGTAGLIGLGCWLWRRKPFSIQQPSPFPGGAIRSR